VQVEKTPLWYKSITKDFLPEVDTNILNFGFVRSKVDHSIYSKEKDGYFIYVALYVDEMLLVRKIMDAIKEVKKKLSSKFDMKNIGAVKLILGMDIKRDWVVRKLCLNQWKYIETILKNFNM
jgi:hypothetical protein